MGHAYLMYHKIKREKVPSILGVFGVKIDTANPNPETALTYIDDATGFTPASGNNGIFSHGSWENVYPFSEIKPCILKNGVVNYYLNPNDYTKKLDGSNADITSGNDGDVMIEIPKVYWKFETIGSDLYIRYSDKQTNSTFKCLAHTKGVVEKNKIYISSYMGSSLNGKLRSLSGQAPTYKETIKTFRTQAQSNGADYDQMAYYQLLMLQVLYLVMFKNRDSQTALGRGYVTGNPSSRTTGGANAKGLFYGENTGKQQMKFCGIEDFYGNIAYCIDGIFCDANRNILIGNQNFNDTGSGYTNYGQGATTNLVGYIMGVQGGTETGFITKSIGASSTTYYTDRANLTPSRMGKFGGGYYDGLNSGAFNFEVDVSPSVAGTGTSARLLFM